MVGVPRKPLSRRALSSPVSTSSTEEGASSTVDFEPLRRIAVALISNWHFSFFFRSSKPKTLMTWVGASGFGACWPSDWEGSASPSKAGIARQSQRYAALARRDAPGCERALARHLAENGAKNGSGRLVRKLVVSMGTGLAGELYWTQKGTHADTRNRRKVQAFPENRGVSGRRGAEQRFSEGEKTGKDGAEGES